jgi:hypothetical protein
MLTIGSFIAFISCLPRRSVETAVADAGLRAKTVTDPRRWARIPSLLSEIPAAGASR